MARTLDVAALRKHFPALDKKQVYFDNAGGSQVLKEVVDEYVAERKVRALFSPKPLLVFLDIF